MIDIHGRNFGFDYYLSSQAQTWKSARAVCRYHGMNLIRIDSHREYDWFARAFGKFTPWIGANDLDHEGRFVSSDGCRQQYLKWAPRQPDNYRNEEDCVHLTEGGLNDKHCERRYRFLCKRSNKKLRKRCGELIFSK